MYKAHIIMKLNKVSRYYQKTIYYYYYYYYYYSWLASVYQMFWTGDFWSPAVCVFSEDLGISEVFSKYVRCSYSSAAFCN